jgi:membrane protease subunit (stomatin/prohibitin family)
MMRRRRPLLRAAMVGGAGYMAGRRMAEQDQREANQDQQLADLQAGAAGPPPAASASSTDRVEALTKLKELLDAGVLSEAEFAAEKAKILQGG